MNARFMRRLARDRRGVSAVEFAFIAPLMLLIYFGVSILGGAVLAQRKASHVASALGDLVAQTTATSPEEMASLFKVGEQIMSPFDAAPLKMRVTSLQADSGGNVTVAWSQASHWEAYTMGAEYRGLPPGVLPRNQTLIMAEVHYTYASPIEGLPFAWAPGSRPFNQTLYLQPRQSGSVDCPACR